jgi:isopenicillin N synthase-like dioxygenase
MAPTHVAECVSLKITAGTAMSCIQPAPFEIAAAVQKIAKRRWRNAENDDELAGLASAVRVASPLTRLNVTDSVPSDSVPGVAAVPLVDIAPLFAPDVAARDRVAHQIDAACRNNGFFLITGHGVSPTLMHDLDQASRAFFAQPEAEKEHIAMANGGRSWRGWFPLGGELTRGQPDGKEGIYFGRELRADDPRVQARLALHGPNQFPSEPSELKPLVLAWLDAMTSLGHTLMAAIGEGLGLGADWFASNLTADPVELFRIFTYPPNWPGEWGVAEHTDYGLLTILMQDDCGGLQVRSTLPNGSHAWEEVTPIPGTFVCNIGDMLERMTGGRYRSTPHRVANASGRERVSFPFFFDPSWNAHVRPLPLADGLVDLSDTARWDSASVFDFEGTYGDYLTAKVARVFPELFASVS